jgi:HD-GYP domain-containing protein (c-di-GMP phosphodiesterase class II)
MPKRISVDQLRVGMYLAGIEGRWLDHPFWRTRFLIRDEATLAKLKASGLRECFIDPSKGEDVAVPLPGTATEPVAGTAMAETAMAEIATAEGTLPATSHDPSAGTPPVLADAAVRVETAVAASPGGNTGEDAEPRPAAAAPAEPVLPTDPTGARAVAATPPAAPTGDAVAPDGDRSTLAPAPAAPRPGRQVMTPAEHAFAAELDRAATVLDRAQAAVEQLQAQVRSGQPLRADGLETLLDEMLASQQRERSALVSLARLKRFDTYGTRHPVAVAALMLALAQELGLDITTTRNAGLAGLLHDLDQAALPVALLDHPGALDETAMAQVRAHAAGVAARLADRAHWPADVAEACAQHHERLDGTGYPQGLAGDAIGRLARMLAICDVYDARTSNRPYQHPLDPAEAIAQLAASQGSFDGAIVSAFVRRLGLYPVGSLVGLESDRLAVVLWQNPMAMSDPVVRVFYSLTEQRRISPQLLDLASPDASDYATGRVSPTAWPVGNVEALWSHGHAARLLGPGAEAGRALLQPPLRD